MVLSISGLSSQLALKLIDTTKDRQLETMQSEPQHARAAEAFRERVGSISTPAELVADYEVYSFIMKAYDLEDQIFGKGMVRKVLESDPSDSSSLVNKLTDARFETLHEALGFVTEDGVQIPDFADTDWQETIVDEYYNRQFINQHTEQNEIVGAVLQFRDEAESINNWFEVMADETMAEFFQVALSLPSEIAELDIDKQKEIYADKFDLADLADPEVREGLITRYAAISEALNPSSFSSGSTALSLLQTSASSSSIIEITMNIDMVSFSASSLYR